jgi:hypothetical protein
MPEAELTDLMQRCIDMSPTLTWMNSPENFTTVMWILGLEFLFHSVLLMVCMMKAFDLIAWLVGKGYGLIRKGWAWHRQKGA